MNPELREEEFEDTREPEASEAEKKAVRLYDQRYRLSKNEFSSKHAQWKIIDMFDRGEQWKDTQLPPWVAKPIHNLIKKNRMLKRANLSGNIPAAHYAPINPDHKDLIDRLQKAYKHVWDTNRVSYVVRRCIDRMYLFGTSIACVYEDPVIDGEYYGEGNAKNRLYQGEIRVKRFPNTNFFPDPDGHRLEECVWVETTENTTIGAVRNNKKFRAYAGDKLDRLKNGTTFEDGDGSTTMDRDIGQFTDQPSKDNDRCVLHTHWEYVYEDDGKRRLDVSYYIPGNDFRLLYIKDVKPAIFPFAVLYDEEEDEEFWGSSTAADILEKQKLVNKTEQTASIIGTMFQNPQKIVARESGISGDAMAKFGTQPGKVWVTNIDPTRSVYTIQPPDVPKGLFELKDRAVQDVNDYVGINEAYTGESVGSLTTSTGVNSLIDRATIRDRDKMKQIDRFVEQLSDLIVMFIIHKWKDKRPIINVGQSGKVEPHMWEPIEKGEADNLKWFVRSDVYSSAPITQALKKQQADQLLQVQQQFNPDPAIITLEEWLHAQDFDNKDEILKRMQEDKKKKEDREAKNLANIIMQVANQARMMLQNGDPFEQVNNAMIEQAQKILEQDAAKAAKIGMGQDALLDSAGGRQRDAAKTPQGPQGDTGQMAMANMTRGQ